MFIDTPQNMREFMFTKSDKPYNKMPNPIAKSLRSAHLKPKVVRSKKIYSRKIKHR